MQIMKPSSFVSIPCLSGHTLRANSGARRHVAALLYVFASPTMKGKQPYWPDNLMKRYIKPVARKAGINKNIGWHTFRHSFGTLLKANGEDVKTVQELLRHANSRITLDVYTQAVNSNKRAAQSKVVRMMVSDVGQKREERYPQTVQ
jgi:integrase